MISWLQNFLLRRGRYLFLALLVVVVVSFVFVIGETPGCVTPDLRQQPMNYHGFDLNDERTMQRFVSEVIVSSIINRGTRPRDGSALEQELLVRLALLRLADDLSIPPPDAQAFQRFIMSKPIFFDETGQFDPAMIGRILDLFEISQQIDEATVNRAIIGDFRIEILMELLGSAGVVLPFEAEKQSLRERATIDLSVARLTKDQAEASEPDEETLAVFFAQRADRYREPERRVFSQAVFPLERFLPAVSQPSDSDLQAFLDAESQRFPEEATVETHRDEIAKGWREQRARRMAQERAVNFVFRIFDEEIGLGTDAFDAALSRDGLTLEEMPPVVANDAPIVLAVSANAARELFRLDRLRFYSDPMVVSDGVAVFFLQEVLPPAVPPLEEIRQAVLADWQAEEARRLLREQGERARESILAALADGVEFAEAAEAAGLQVKSFEGVSWLQRGEVSGSVLRRAEAVAVGEPSEFIMSGDGGEIIFVSKRFAPPLEDAAFRLAQMRENLEFDAANRFSSAFLSELVEAGLARAQSR